MLLITLLTLLQLAAAAPAYNNKITRGFSIKLTNADTGDCNALIEDAPWNVTNVQYFEAKPTNDSVSYITFNVQDTNPGLELQTVCGYNLPLGSTGKLVDDKYHICENKTVQFKFTGNAILLDRLYRDDCIGVAPLNSVIAHGRANTTFTKTAASDGILATQTGMLIPISSLS